MEKLPRIVFGTWAWGNDGTFGPALDEEALRPVFDAAMQEGTVLWDTAYVYGMGESEKLLGRFLRHVPRDAYMISDKFTPQCANADAENPVSEMFEISAHLLGSEQMDYYWIHNPLDAPRWVKKIIPLAKAGKIGKIGLSNHSLAQIHEAQQILAEAGLAVGAVQNHFSLLNRSSAQSGILNYCHSQGIPFFSYMVLEQGALSGKFDEAHPFPAGSERARVYDPMLKQLTTLNAGLQELADRHQCSIAQLAIAWAIAKGTVPIIGVTKRDQVTDAIAAASVALSEAEVLQMEKLADQLGICVVRSWEEEMR